MTDQAAEILSFKGETFYLENYPLYQYTRRVRNIEFGVFDTAHWRGYQGSWTITDRRLYLTSLEGNNIDLEAVFGTSDPVLADWYSGFIKFSIDEKYATDGPEGREIFVQFEIESGRVVDTTIVFEFPSNPVFRFGKYKDLHFREVLFGRLHSHPRQSIHSYLDCLLTYLTTDTKDIRVQFPFFVIDTSDRDLVRDLRFIGLRYLLTQTYIAVSTPGVSESTDRDEYAESFSALIEKVLSGDFAIRMTLSHPSSSNEMPIARETLAFLPDPSYTDWALKTVNGFTVDPRLIESPQQLVQLKNFKTRRLNSTIFEFEAVLETVLYEFPIATQEINAAKFEKMHGVKYDSAKEVFIPNLTEDEFDQKFGFYFDDRPKTEATVGVRLDTMSYQEPYDYNYRHYDEEYYSDDWRIDAAGTDDPETMNDVYWNLD